MSYQTNINRVPGPSRSAEPLRRPMDAYSQAMLERTWQQVHVDDARAWLAVAKAGGDSEEIKSRTENLRRLTETLARATTRLKQTEATMALTDTYAEITSAWKQKVGDALGKIAEIEGDEKLPAAYRVSEKDRRLREVRAADQLISSAMGNWQQAAAQEADKWRASADAGVDATTRLANQMEHTALVADRRDGSYFLGEARKLLSLGQPQRAALLFGVAQAKGTADLMIGQTGAAIEAALDEAIPDRAKASAVERLAVDKTSEFKIGRMKALSVAGGIGPSGEVGHGTQSERSTAGIAATMGDYFEAERKGEKYSEEFNHREDGRIVPDETKP